MLCIKFRCILIIPNVDYSPLFQQWKLFARDFRVMSAFKYIRGRAGKFKEYAWYLVRERTLTSRPDSNQKHLTSVARKQMANGLFDGYITHNSKTSVWQPWLSPWHKTVSKIYNLQGRSFLRSDHSYNVQLRCPRAYSMLYTPCHGNFRHRFSFHSLSRCRNHLWDCFWLRRMLYSCRRSSFSHSIPWLER